MSIGLLGFTGNKDQNIICKNLQVYELNTSNSSNITNSSSISSEGLFLQYNRTNDGKSYIINQKGSNIEGGISLGKSDQSNNYTEQLLINEDNTIVLSNSITTSKLITRSLRATQNTSLTTPVTLNSQNGYITTFIATLAPLTFSSFVFNNSYITANCIMNATIIKYNGAYSTNGVPVVQLDNILLGTCNITIINAHPTNALNGYLILFFQIYDLN